MTAQIVPSVSMTSYFLYGILIYLAAINVAAFFLYSIDKWKAQRNKWRITEAKELLAHSNKSISTIAYDLGFANSNQLSTFFRQHEGISPRDFRNGFRTEH